MGGGDYGFVVGGEKIKQADSGSLRFKLRVGSWFLLERMADRA